MNEPGVVCSHCGVRQAAQTPYCARCGGLLRAEPEGFLSVGIQVVATVVLLFATLCLGSIGACFALAGMMGVGSEIGVPLFIFGVLGLVAAGICLWGIPKIINKL